MGRGDRGQRRDDIRPREADIAQLPVAEQAKIKGRSPPQEQTLKPHKRGRKGMRTGGGRGEGPGEAGTERDDVGHKGCFQIEGNSDCLPPCYGDALPLKQTRVP